MSPQAPVTPIARPVQPVRAPKKKKQPAGQPSQTHLDLTRMNLFG
jgi:hypothetical protein